MITPQAGLSLTTSPPLPSISHRSRRHHAVATDSRNSSSSIPISLQVRCCSSQPPNPPPPPLPLSIPDWIDSVKERGVYRRRSLYTSDSWRDHRSSRRYLRHVLSSLSSRVIVSLITPVTVFTTFAAAVAAYNSAVDAAWLPTWLPLLRTNPLPYQLTAPALALLLVFRTEASYERYVEGRRAWMRVMVGTSDFATAVMSLAVAERSEDYGLKKALLSYILAFPVALKCHVISGSDANSELQTLLGKEDLSVVLGSEHRPHCIISFILQSLHMIHMEEAKRNLLESKISCFHEGIGACEQLLGIPIPLSYTRLTSRFLVFWHITLPVVLWDDCNWFAIPATSVSAAALFCIEEVGVLIEEPFPMLPLDEMCKQVQRSIQEVLATENAVKGCVLSKSEKHNEYKSPNGWPKS